MQLILKPHKRVSKIEYILICPQPLFPHADHRSQMVQDKPLARKHNAVREANIYPFQYIAYLNIYEDELTNFIIIDIYVV